MEGSWICATTDVDLRITHWDDFGRVTLTINEIIIIRWKKRNRKDENKERYEVEDASPSQVTTNDLGDGEITIFDGWAGTSEWL